MERKDTWQYLLCEVINSIKSYTLLLALQSETKVTDRTRKTLKNKVDEHNDDYGDKKGKRVTVSMLSNVFSRGIGAFRTNPASVRPNVQSEDQWAYARVNAFLYAVRTGKFKGGKFDTDLLPKDHPLHSGKD